VLGGLIDQQRELTTSGIPFLQDIPLLGVLFRSTQWRHNNTELFLFLTPRVLRGDQDVERVTEGIQERPLIRDLLRRAEPPVPAGTGSREAPTSSPDPTPSARPPDAQPPRQ
jgi:general secretion pathway protein D